MPDVALEVVEAAISYLIEDNNDPRDYPVWAQPKPGVDSAWAVIEALREAQNG